LYSRRPADREWIAGHRSGAATRFFRTGPGPPTGGERKGKKKKNDPRDVIFCAQVAGKNYGFYDAALERPVRQPKLGPAAGCRNAAVNNRQTRQARYLRSRFHATPSVRPRLSTREESMKRSNRSPGHAAKPRLPAFDSESTGVLEELQPVEARGEPW